MRTLVASTIASISTSGPRSDASCACSAAWETSGVVRMSTVSSTRSGTELVLSPPRTVPTFSEGRPSSGSGAAWKRKSSSFITARAAL